MNEIITQIAPTGIGAIVATIGFIYMGIGRADKIKSKSWEDTIATLNRQIETLERENRRLVEMVDMLEKKLSNLENK